MKNIPVVYSGQSDALKDMISSYKSLICSYSGKFH